MIKAKIQKVSISAVKENDANPRFINKHKFKKQMQTGGSNLRKTDSSKSGKTKILNITEAVELLNKVKELLNNKYLKERMNNFSFKRASQSKYIKSGDISFDESEETTHYSIVDKYGNAVSVQQL